MDVRVIAATNKNLEVAPGERHFREDLYFRLAVIPISVPPLRERTEDIPLLVRHYRISSAAESNARPRWISQSALDALQRYRWKGNIRELRNTVERLIIMSPGETIEPHRSARDPSAARRQQGRPHRCRATPPLPTRVRPARCASSRTMRNAPFSWQNSAKTAGISLNTAELIHTPRSNLYKKLEA